MFWMGTETIIFFNLIKSKGYSIKNEGERKTLPAPDFLHP